MRPIYLKIEKLGYEGGRLSNIFVSGQQCFDGVKKLKMDSSLLHLLSVDTGHWATKGPPGLKPMHVNSKTVFTCMKWNELTMEYKIIKKKENTIQ